MNNDIQNELIPLDEFAKKKNISATKIIEMVHDGFYRGRKINNEWFIGEHEEENKVEHSIVATEIARILVALVLSPGIGYSLAYVFSLNVTNFEGYRSLALFYWSIILTLLSFVIILVSMHSQFLKKLVFAMFNRKKKGGTKP